MSQLATAHSNRRLHFDINEFFRANPEEELTHEQVALKFDLTQEEANAAIAYLVKRGLLEQVRIVRTAR